MAVRTTTGTLIKKKKKSRGRQIYGAPHTLPMCTATRLPRRHHHIASCGRCSAFSHHIAPCPLCLRLISSPITQAFGMQLHRTRDNPEEKYTIALLGYGPEGETPVLELTYNYGVTEYDRGNAYAQIAIGFDDVYKTADLLRAFGGKITREPGPLPGINTKITAVLDPDGWKSVFVDNADFQKELE